MPVKCCLISKRVSVKSQIKKIPSHPIRRDGKFKSSGKPLKHERFGMNRKEMTPSRVDGSGWAFHPRARGRDFIGNKGTAQIRA
jgi:hypothetical protein